VPVTFEFSSITFKNDLQIRNLGTIPNFTEKYITKYLLKANRKLIPADLEIKDITETSAIISVKEGSTTYKEDETAVIEYQIPAFKVSQDLQLPANRKFYSLTNSSKDIFTSIKKNFRNLKLDEVDITYHVDDGYFEVQAKETSKYYRLEKPQRINFKILNRFNLARLEDKFKGQSLDFVNKDNKVEQLNYLEKLIPKFLVRNEGYIPNNPNLAVNKDYEITLTKENNKDYLFVRSKENSEYLIGEAKFLVRNVRFSLDDYFSEEHHKAFNNAGYYKDEKYLTVEDIKQNIADKNAVLIKQDYNVPWFTDNLKNRLYSALEIDTYEFYYLQHRGLDYYKNVKFKINNNADQDIKDVFGAKASISLSNIMPPIYSSGDSE